MFRPRTESQLTKTFVSTKSVITLVSLLFLITAIAVQGCLYYFLTSLDKQAAIELTQRVSLANRIESDHKQQLLSEYSYWDDSYENLVLFQSEEWADFNIKDYVIANHEFDFVIAIKQSDNLVYLETSDKAKDVVYDEDVKSELSFLIDESDRLDTQTQTTTGYVRIKDSVYFVVGGPFIDESSISARAGTYLLFGRRWDDAYLANISSRYQIPDLKIGDSLKGGAFGEPLRSPSGHNLGVLTWTAPRPSKEVMPSIVVLTTIFFFVAIAITRLVLKKDMADRNLYEHQLYLEATYDSLTNIYNRRHFFEEGKKLLHSHQQRHRFVSVIVFDIDHFKQINDSHGHRIGDSALRHFVNITSMGIRESDILGRIGGEEFAILLPDTSCQAAFEIAERIRLLLVKQPLLVNQATVSFTVSGGVAAMDSHDYFESLIEHADQALYRAKAHGRNQIQSYPLLKDEASAV
jgi:diguanylate cyclase (GGDEF)-like protein